MKKRILALALVVISLVTVLTGCAYRYDRKDMSKYATVADNYAGLNALLKSITVEGDNFGPYIKGDYKRDDKVLEKIDATLAGKIATDAAKLSGDDAVFAYYQKIFYAYYCTVEKDGVTYYFNTKNMDDAKLQSFLSNPTYTNGVANKALVADSELTKAIYAALEGNKIDDYKYDSVSTGDDALKAGDLVFVTYTYRNKNDSSAKAVTSEYMLIEVKDVPVVEEVATTPTEIGQLLVGKKLGKIESTTEAPIEFVSGDVTYSVDSMTVHFKVAAGKEVAVDFTATATEAVGKFVNAKDTAQDKIEVKEGDVVTYHIYPAYVNAVEALSATSVIKTIFGESISTSSLSIFTENEKMKTIVEKVAKLKSEYDTANSAAGSSPTEAQKTTRDEAKKKFDAAYASLTADLFATDTGAEALILKAYKESVYETLEASHDAAVQEQIGEQLWNWIKKNVVVDTANLPKAAVKEAKERILAGHKNAYYTGTDSTTKLAYRDTLTFKEYLATIAYKGKDVEATMEAEAQAQVVEIIRVYAVAQKYSANVKKVTDADISVYVEQNYFTIYYNLIISGEWTGSSYPSTAEIREIYGDTALRCALTFDRIMDYFLATEEDADGHVKYLNIKEVKYK